MGIPDHLTCLLRNLYAGQEATVRTGHGTTDWFQVGKGVCQGFILSPCLFNLHAEYIMRNTGLDEAQTEIKIVRRNANNLRYADDTTCREPAYCIVSAYCILSAALSTASSFRIWNSSTGSLSLPGASVRNSAHDKGHEEGGSA